MTTATGAPHVARYLRHRALLDYAARCEQDAWNATIPARAVDLYQEAINARLAALAIEAQQDD